MLNDIVEAFNSFRTKIDDVELSRAKNILKRNILLNMANQGDRLEEAVKSVNIKLANILVQYLWNYQPY
jgi:hypothetical protein